MVPAGASAGGAAVAAVVVVVMVAAAMVMLVVVVVVVVSTRCRMYLPDVEAGGNTATTESKVPTAILGSELRNSQSPWQSYWQLLAI